LHVIWSGVCLVYNTWAGAGLICTCHQSMSMVVTAVLRDVATATYEGAGGQVMAYVAVPDSMHVVSGCVRSSIRDSITMDVGACWPMDGLLLDSGR